MIFDIPKKNIMPEILDLASDDWREVTEDTLGVFRLILVAGGFTVETEEELYRSFYALKDIEVFDIKEENEKVYFRRLING